MSRARVLVTGAAGFIGRVVCERLGHFYEVIGLDDESRYGPTPTPAGCAKYIRARVEDINAVGVPGCEHVIHLAAQTAVTKSYDDPYLDLASNALGALAVARWAVTNGVRSFVHASTNKVFGELPGQCTPVEDEQPWRPQTPYGISKAAGALYVLDLVPCAVVLHQSCIVGPTQQGTVDQGWVSYLARCAKEHRPVTCYGNGKQVRDLLHVRDLVTLYHMVIERHVPPGAYVCGGGEGNAYSFERVCWSVGAEIKGYEAKRPHDQDYFVSANSGLTDFWSPGHVYLDEMTEAA